MKLSTASLLLLGSYTTNAAFVPGFSTPCRARVITKGYLDDLSGLKEDEEDERDDSYEATQMKEEQKDRYGPGQWEGFVDFDEFDGGDGQMGVAGDGNKGLEKFGQDVQPQLAKSKMMSAKNAWGSSSGYAEELAAKGMESTRAQQMENWRNQQEIQAGQRALRNQAEAFDKETGAGEEDWRQLAKFGVERVEEFDLNEEFGQVTPGDTIEGTIELHSRINSAAVHEFGVKNDFMGFADFRAAFVPGTSMEWTITPTEGSLTKTPVDFILKFRPQNPGVSEGYLVIETEDMKKTWKLIGNTA